MSKCEIAKRTDEFHGWECPITDGPCVFLYPDADKCAQEYGEGPKAIESEVDNGKV